MTARFAQVVAGLAIAKIAIALLALAWGRVDGPIVQVGTPLNTVWFSTLLVLAYAGTGAALPRISRFDPRAREFGIFLMLIASSFSPLLIRSGHQFGALSTLALRCRVDVFLPVFLWMFVRDFPVRAPVGRTGTWPWRFVRLSMVIGSVLFLTNLVFDLRGIYWPLLLALMMPAAPALLDRARHVGRGDRRRVLFFVLAISAGMLPIAIDIVLLAASPRWLELSSHPPWSWTAVAVLAALISVPAVTAYSVVVDRVLDLRLMARVALQYALARYTIILLIVMPLVWALWSAFQARAESIADLLATRPFAVGAAAFSLVVMLPTRRRLLHTLDRQFFREQYDTDKILGTVVEASRDARSIASLAQLLATEIDRALHPNSLAVLIRQHDSQRFEAMGGAARPLPASSLLTTILGTTDQPLDIEPLKATSILSHLDSDTVVWLADSDFRMLVPLRGGSGALRGFIALGEKKSELPFSTRDRSILGTIGATGGLCLEAYLTKQDAAESESSAGEPRPADLTAQECPVCGLLHDAHVVVCQCGAALTASRVPRLLAGKFRMVQRIGSGGMGVVYRAIDVGLERTVAVKALRGQHPRDAWRLRREARAMALITHANLASVFGLEFWFGRPFLIVEYLAGGTLADRLAARRTMAEDETARFGMKLAGVLGVLHKSGMLHRDIKPANIGFTGDGVVKLLDFGLARHVSLSGEDATNAVPSVPIEVPHADHTHTATGWVMGTVAYMSPEALVDARPDDRFDLWSLAVTLFEAMAGVNPYRNLPPDERRRPGPAPDPRVYVAGCSANAAAFFAEALAPSPTDRPASAEAFARLLRRCFLDNG